MVVAQRPESNEVSGVDCDDVMSMNLLVDNLQSQGDLKVEINEIDVSVCTYIHILNIHICMYLFTSTVYITYRWYSSILGPK